MFLLDANVISELRKVRLGRADKNVAQWAHGMTLVTRNLADFQSSGVTIINPWE